MTTKVDEGEDAPFASYAPLARALLPDLSGIGLFDASLAPSGRWGDLDVARFSAWMRSLCWVERASQGPESTAFGMGYWWSALPIRRHDGSLLGVFCTSQPLEQPPAKPDIHARLVARHLKPLLDCIRRELSLAAPVHEKLADLTERTTELEWLFKTTSDLKGAVEDHRVIEELLAAATGRVGAVLGILCVPDKRLNIKCETDATATGPLLEAWRQTQQHLITWAQRQNKPLVINGGGAKGKGVPRCKLLCVPVVRDTGRVIGVLAFYNAFHAPDFVTKHLFLARHLGRQAAALVEAQFDLMTGLYTRGGLDQIYRGFDDETDCSERSVIYLDIDHMHVANELHGFELGNELIVRVADILAAPLLPDDALAARIAGDRFAVILPRATSTQATEIAAGLLNAVSKLVIGPSKEAIELSISCGISALLPMPDGLARAIAAAELACKTAKNRGRNRIELYAFEDGSMMRRHRDAIAVGQLRSALKSDRLLLYAQRIAPLQDASLPGGYELLLRLRETDGSLVAPGPLIEAAQRYQILPSVDRWVIHKALQMLGPYRSMLRSRGLSMSINVSGQSIGDEAFIQQFLQLLKEANLPRGCVSVELTEQAAVTNLVHANRMVERIGAAGCEFALDDFGTGANSLTVLKGLRVNRVKIDGSFVRDILTDKNSLATVRATVELAKGLRIQTVGEYVESNEIATELRRLGVDYAQGYALGKPEPLSDLLEALTRDESQRLHRLYLDS